MVRRTQGATMDEPQDTRLADYLEDMRLLDPAYEFIRVDFWDENTIAKLENVKRKPGKRERYTADIQSYSLIYSRGRYIPVELDILDRETGRRLRQDGEDDLHILELLAKRCAE